MPKSSELTSGSSDVLVLRGAAAILAQSPLLEELAHRCGQPGAMHWLHYFLTAPSYFRKEPYLVLVLRSSLEAQPVAISNVCAAVLMFEYRLAGVPSRAFSTDDVSGFRTVIAPAGQHAAVAEIAANAVLEQGAQFVLISYCDAVEPAAAPALKNTHAHALEWARRLRPVEKRLPLSDSFDATLATLGKSTRFNLRYYRKRLLKRMVCEFVGDVCGLLRETELSALNAGSLNPISAELFHLQYRSACELPGGFIVGLRDAQGKWLSLIGGWRQDDLTVLHWQTNAAGFEKDSIGTVMRSFFLEHEIERGAKHLVVYGGTTHSMGNSFVREKATDLIVRRESWKGALLRMLSGMYCTVDRFVGGTNFLARAIGKDELEWHRATQASDSRAPNGKGEANKTGANKTAADKTAGDKTAGNAVQADDSLSPAPLGHRDRYTSTAD